MAMSNSAFHKLLTEFDVNYKYNIAFQEYCNAQGIMYTGFYGEITAKTEHMKDARTFWKKNHKVWYLDFWEAEESIDHAPFGGWKSEKQELTFLKTIR